MKSENWTLLDDVVFHWSRVVSMLDAFGWMAPLLVRLFVGYFFFDSGWSKLHNLDQFAQNFAGWGIPYPEFNAALSAYTECIGGFLTMAGFGMRLVSIPMIINMAVAIVTVKLKEVSGLSDFVNLDEPLYALFYVWLLFSGAGAMSLDALVMYAIGCKRRESGLQGSTAVAAEHRAG
jgi:putative oxidoreductase